MNRTTRCARFIVDEAGGGTPVPMLWDAALVFASYDVWVFSGTERVASDSGDERAYAQTWLLTTVERAQRPSR